MLSTSFPGFFQIPFANAAGAGYIRAIPQASQVGITAGAASLQDGFPPLNFVDPATAGGIPPSGADMNGILYQISANIRWQQAGNFPAYNAAFATGIGGYPKGAVLMNITATGMWSNTVESNTSNPDAGGAGWVAVGASSVPWTGVTGKPTTISGYGITDVNTYAPTLAGVGASGTWPISVTGNASTATGLPPYYSGGAAGVMTGRTYRVGAYSYSANNDPNAPTAYFAAVGFGAGAGSVEIGGNWVNPSSGLWYRALRDTIDTWYTWTRIVDSANIGTYAPTLTGAGATGTWPINISGTVTTAAQPAILSVGTSLATTGTGTVNITADGRLYGTALHNNANPVTGTTNQYIASGTYTPIITLNGNVTSAAYAGVSSKWIRAGNVVTVSGVVLITPTATGSSASIFISLPIASVFSSGYDLAGTGGSPGGSTSAFMAAYIIGNTSGSRSAQLLFWPSAAGVNGAFSYHFQYEIV